jgi:hypothetical protein
MIRKQVDLCEFEVLGKVLRYRYYPTEVEVIRSRQEPLMPIGGAPQKVWDRIEELRKEGWIVATSSEVTEMIWNGATTLEIYLTKVKAK